MVKGSPSKVDALVESLTVEVVQENVDEFASLLDSGCDEQIIHRFLARHTYFFNGIIRLFGKSPLYSKIKLADQFEIDFVCFDSGSVGPEWYLIEIESPSKNIFTKAGELTAHANHALQQVRDWQDWIHENLSLAQKLMPQIQYPHGYVFIGRRSEYTTASIKRLRRIKYDVKSFAEIHSLDWFISAGKSVLGLLKNSERGNWSLPMKALRHSDLRKGLPSRAKEYIDRFMESPLCLYPDEILRDRKNFKYSISENYE